MNNQQTIEAAIGKALDNGWTPEYPVSEWIRSDNLYNPGLDYPRALTIIFSHDFAKAFWKNGPKMCWYSGYNEWAKYDRDAEETGESEWTGLCLPSWKYCLQQMVLSKDPIKYLSKFL
jgi:hypothetical protein